jgi:cell shape-determining protein MreC
MKKPYSLKRNSRQSFGVGGGYTRRGVGAAAWPLGITTACVVLLILIRLIFPGAFMVLATPFWQLGTAASAASRNFFGGFSNASRLSQENAALNTQVTTLQNQNAVLTARSQDLTKLLGGQSDQSATGNILAGVLARPPVSAYDTLVVAMGSKDGVQVGAEVYDAGGVPLGTVKSLTPHTATVELLSTAGLSTDGWEGEARVPITLVGTGAGTFTTSLSKAATSTIGDNVYVSGPGAVPVGTVARLEQNPSSPTVVLDIQPLVNIFSVTWVSIAR